MKKEVDRNKDSTKDVNSEVSLRNKRRFRFRSKGMYAIVAVFVVIAIAVGSILIFKPGSRIYGDDLMEGVTPNTVEGKAADDEFSKAVIDFSIELFKRGQTKGVNSLISPLSVYISLAMVANGADGETREQFEEVLGDGISIDELNAYVYSLIKNLPNERESEGSEMTAIVDIANSIWFDDTVKPFDEFLQKNADYYGAGVYKADLSSGGTIDRINNWIKENTEGLIDKVIEQIDPTVVMYLINTLIFDEEWSTDAFLKYDNTEKDIRPFYTEDNKMVEVEYMTGSNFQYIENDEATGFIYKYKNVEDKRNFSFVAILPNEDILVNEYVDNLTGDEFRELIDFESSRECEVVMPKFKYEYSVDLKSAIADMGLVNATDEGKADFSNIGDFNTRGVPFIDKVIHNTIIEVNEEGTKAGAVTAITWPLRGLGDAYSYVTLNRPFVYAIVDNETKIPFFIGTVSDFEGEKTEVNGIPTNKKIIGDFEVTINEYSFPKSLSIDKYIGNSKEAEIPWNLDDYVVVKISGGVFSRNENIETIKISGGRIEYIEDGAFSECPNLEKIYMLWSPWYTGKDLFKGSRVTLYFDKDAALAGMSGDGIYFAAIREGIKIVEDYDADIIFPEITVEETEETTE